LKQLKPDVIVVSGTSLLSSKVVSIPSRFTLNIHGGILPCYRNVHSDFWAYYHKDYANIGSSIVYVDQGIDTGDVALQRSVKIDARDTLFSTKAKNLQLAGDLIVEALRNLENDTLDRVKQPKTKGSYYKTPRLIDWLRLVFREKTSS